jgi:hypothetical protein
VNHHQAAAGLTTAAGWRKSSYSQGANGCVEITTQLPGWVGIRDSKLGPDSPLLILPLSEWRAMIAAARTDEVNA